MKFQITNRHSGDTQFEAEIDCAADASISTQLGLAVQQARETGATLRDANLRGADLRGADLSGADLSGARLRDDGFKGVPKIQNIHQVVYAAASKEGALDMGCWHTCASTHCRAGWVTTLAGEGGAALEFAMGVPAAAAMIYLASDPGLDKVPNFYASDEVALNDMKRLSEQEAAA